MGHFKMNHEPRPLGSLPVFCGWIIDKYYYIMLAAANQRVLSMILVLECIVTYWIGHTKAWTFAR